MPFIAVRPDGNEWPYAVATPHGFPPAQLVIMMPSMPADESHEIRYVTEPILEGVRFILPRIAGGAKGGCCAILFGMMFSGFALVWMAGVSGLLDPFLESVVEPIFEGFDDANDREQMRKHREEVDKYFDEDGQLKPKLETPGPESPGPETPSAESPNTPPTAPNATTKSPRSVSRGFDFGSIFMMLFGIPFFLAGLAPITMGILIMLGHSEVEITQDFVTSTSRAGPLRRRQKRIATDLIRLEVGRGPHHREKAQQAIASGKPKPTFSINAIHAEFKDASPLTLAAGYPMATLRALAKDIESEHQRITSVRNVAIEEPHVKGEESAPATEPYVPETVPPQPVSSVVDIERVSSGFTLRIPPAGFSKAAMAPFLFGVIWCGFTLIFTLVMLATGVPLIMLAFISIFWLAGIAVLVLGLSMMRRKAVIDVVHDTLLVTQQGLFRRTQNEWRTEDLLDVRVDHSGTTVNNHAIQNLQFVPREGSIVGLGTGRDEEELHWMAAEIRTALRMKKRE